MDGVSDNEELAKQQLVVGGITFVR
jgi:hypothetical protein